MTDRHEYVKELMHHAGHAFKAEDAAHEAAGIFIEREDGGLSRLADAIGHLAAAYGADLVSRASEIDPSIRDDADSR